MNLFHLVEKVRKESPLVQNITNYVVMNNTANAMLAAGASPIMSHAVEEAADMMNICQALVVNIGTLSPAWIQGMKAAMTAAKSQGKPIILDPVGAGATPYRNQTIKELLQTAAPTIIRGNASEIMAVAGENVQTKGVDSSNSSIESLDAARQLSKEFNAVVVVSGETDLVVYKEQLAFIKNGHPMMCQVTGLGCSATALLGAFAVVEKDPFVAATAGTAFIAICGELAQQESKGPGSLQVNILDKMHSISEAEFNSALKCEIQKQ